MRRDPLVSIIIPCYNAERYIGESIRSALNQTYSNLEVIVIDDGSTDGSLDVIQSFGQNIRWESGPNRGGSAARNRGLKICKGELVQFLDADDLISEDKLATQVASWRSTQYDLIGSHGMIADIITGRLLGRTQPRRPDLFQMACLDSLGIHSVLHTRSSVSAVGGFREDLKACQDRDLHIRLACAGYRISIVPMNLFTIRRRPGSVSFNHCRAIDQYEAVFVKVFEELSQNGTLLRDQRRALAQVMSKGARVYFRHGEHLNGRRYFSLACSIDKAGAYANYAPATAAFCRLLGPDLTETCVHTWRTLRSPLLNP